MKIHAEVITAMPVCEQHIPIGYTTPTTNHCSARFSSLILATLQVEPAFHLKR
jgi:hypothetical protein